MNLITIVKQLLPLTSKERNGIKVTEEFIPIVRLYFDMLEGDVWACLIMAEILTLQSSEGGLENGGWVVWTFETINKKYYISRHIFNQSADKLIPLGLEKDLRYHPKYPEAIKGVWHYRIDEDVLAQATINYLESQSLPSSKILTTPPKGISHITEVTLTEGKEKHIPQNSLQEEKPSPALKRPTVGNVSFEGSKPTLKDKGRQASSSEWLSGIFKQFWGKPLSDAQIKKLSQPVYAVISTHSGEYPSPMEYAEDIQYGKLFRQWVMDKKNPKDATIRNVGSKRWIDDHIRNYSSPEGFLNWCLKQGVAIKPTRPDNNLITVMESTLYNLVEMDYYCFSRSGSPKSEAEISLTFKTFYAQNISKCKDNEAFKALWENKR